MNLIIDRPRDPRMIQRECQEIAQPYINLISDIYNCSTFTLAVTVGDGQAITEWPSSAISYPPETEALAEKVRAAMHDAIKWHCERSGWPIPSFSSAR